jgi:hypothetical protein
MLINDPLRSAEDRPGAASRRRLHHMAATVAAGAPLAITPRRGVARVPRRRSASHPEGGLSASIWRRRQRRLVSTGGALARIEEKHRDVERELDLWRSVSLSTDFRSIT